MHFYKCKKSVFCIYFLILFGLGTICGVFCFRCQMSANCQWILPYCGAISHSMSTAFVKSAAVLFRCGILMAALSILQRGYRAIFPLIIVRGFLMSYSFSALWIGGCSMISMILHACLILPAYYMLCSWAFFS